MIPESRTSNVLCLCVTELNHPTSNCPTLFPTVEPVPFGRQGASFKDLCCGSTSHSRVLQEFERRVCPEFGLVGPGNPTPRSSVYTYNYSTPLCIYICISIYIYCIYVYMFNIYIYIYRKSEMLSTLSKMSKNVTGAFARLSRRLQISCSSQLR